jgi:hypothetical protein
MKTPVPDSRRGSAERRFSHGQRSSGDQRNGHRYGQNAPSRARVVTEILSVPCHPFPRPVRHRAPLRGRERRRGTTGPRLLPQRSARRAEGSWSGREETAREAPTLSCRTGRGTSKDSPPQADLDDGAAGATRSVARRVFVARPNGRGATMSAARPPDTEPRSPDTSRRPLADRSRALPSRRAPSAVSSAMSRAWPGQRSPQGVRPDAVDRSRRPQEPIAQERPNAHGLHRLTGGQLEELQVSSGPSVILQVPRHTGTPTVVGLPENALQKRGQRRSASARHSVAADNRTSAGDGRRRSQGTAYRDEAEPEPQDRGRPPAVPAPPPASAGEAPPSLTGDAPEAAATGPLQENNRRQSDKAGCEVSPPGPKWRLLW